MREYAKAKGEIASSASGVPRGVRSRRHYRCAPAVDDEAAALPRMVTQFFAG